MKPASEPSSGSVVVWAALPSVGGYWRSHPSCMLSPETTSLEGCLPLCMLLEAMNGMLIWLSNACSLLPPCPLDICFNELGECEHPKSSHGQHNTISAKESSFLFIVYIATSALRSSLQCICTVHFKVQILGEAKRKRKTVERTIRSA
jgi:hypothetical protein